MGLMRKGRSRAWFDDHGWWVIQVLFEAPMFGKASDLVVSVSWLWKLPHMADNHASFDYGWRIPGCFATFESPEQWAPITRRLASRAAEEVRAYRERIPDLRAAARVTDEYARGRVGWHAWDAAVANGLSGNVDTAARHFAAVADLDDDREWWQPARTQARTWERMVRSDHDRFVEQVKDHVENARQQLRLPTVELAVT
jgi:hypothetical protein